MNLAAVLARLLRIGTHQAARESVRCAQAVALLVMLALAAFVVTPTSHVVPSDAPTTSAVSAIGPGRDSLSVGETCCAECPGHNWQTPNQIGFVAHNLPSSSDVVHATADATASSLDVAPPRKPPRIDLRVAGAG